MRKDCLESKYYEFNNSEEFDKFIKELHSKIAKTIQFIGAEKYKTDFHHVYKCNSCEEIWWRGYFLKEKMLKN